MQQGELRAGSLIKWVNFRDGQSLNLCRTLGKGSERKKYCVMTSAGSKRYFDNYDNALIAFNTAFHNRKERGISAQGIYSDRID